MPSRLDTDRLFKTIDLMDADEFVTFLTEDARFVFGNAEPVAGRSAIRDAVAAFYASIKGLHHHDLTTWVVGDVAITEARVTYIRHDESTVEVPFANVFRLDGDLIRDYRIYVDITPLYA